MQSMQLSPSSKSAFFFFSQNIIVWVGWISSALKLLCCNIVTGPNWRLNIESLVLLKNLNKDNESLYIDVLSMDRFTFTKLSISVAQNSSTSWSVGLNLLFSCPRIFLSTQTLTLPRSWQNLNLAMQEATAPFSTRFSSWDD